MSERQSDRSVLSTILDTNSLRESHRAALMRADITSISESGVIEVAPVDENVQPFACDVLESAIDKSTKLGVGDIVLVLSPESPQSRGCILGRICAYRPPQNTPKRLVIEAEEELTLKCGDCSVDLRKDGKLMIRGKDVLTRAKRTQRIKGGTVAIN